MRAQKRQPATKKAAAAAAAQGTTEQAPSPLFCFVLACSGAPAEQTRFVLLCHPATPRWSRRAGGAAGPRLGKEAGAAWGPPPIARASRVDGGLWGGIKQKSEVSPTKSALLEVGASRFARPVHSQRADGIDALHRAFASRPYGPCTCLGADLLCAVRLLHPLASPLTSTTNPPTQLSVPAMRAKPQVLVHAMGAETTEVLVVCSEHVGSAQELANAMPCSRSKYRFFRLVTRVLADSE